MEPIKRGIVMISLAALALSEPVVEFSCGQLEEGSPRGWSGDCSQSSRVCHSLAERIFPHTHAEVNGEAVATFAQPLGVTGNVTVGISHVRLTADICE